MSNRKRVLIIGIDGATFNIINPLIEAGKLPTFEKIIKQGTHGVLNSTLPPASATGWTSLITGKNSGKHDIYDNYDQVNGSYDRKIVDSRNIKQKRIWEILGNYNLKSILVNLPLTYPLDEINGIMVSGMLTPPGEIFTYPEHLAAELIQKDYVVDLYCHISDSLDSFIETALHTMTIRQQVFLDMINQNDWDFAMVMFNTPDRVQHILWQQYSQVEKIYIKLDSLIDDLINNLDDNTYLIIVSEHGFKSITKKFFVNEWLWELGLLSKKISTDRASIPDFVEEQFRFLDTNRKLITKFLASTGITKDKIRSIISNDTCEWLKRVTPEPIKKIFPKENLIIQWDKTKAYFTSQFSQGININLKGREPQGIIEPGKEYEQLRDRIIRELYRLKDPHTFENVIDEVFRGEDIFFGEYVHHAPDIIFIPHDYTYLLEPNKRPTWDCICHAHDGYPVFSHHDPYGIFLINGPSIKCGRKVKNINIFDIVPTVLKILDIPVPHDMDGRVLYKIFEDDDYYSSEEEHYAQASKLMPIYDIGQFQYDNDFILN